MKLWLLVGCIVVILKSSGCAPTTTVRSNRNLTIDEVIRHVKDRGRVINTLKGEGSITVESPEASSSGSFSVDLKKPDSLRVEFSGPFGIHVGTLALSRERFVYYNWRENTATIGKPDSATLRSMLRIPLCFDEILRAFTGDFIAEDTSDSLIHFSVQNNSYVLRYKTPGGVKEYHVDTDDLMMSSYRLIGDDEKPSLIALASHFETSSDVEMPRVVRVIVPKERRSVTIAYDDVAINAPVRCSFALPKQAEVIYR